MEATKNSEVVPEYIEWRPARNPPDADLVVLVSRQASMHGDPVWIGYWTGDEWLSVDGFPFHGITHWADLPVGAGGDL